MGFFDVLKTPKAEKISGEKLFEKANQDKAYRYLVLAHSSEFTRRNAPALAAELGMRVEPPEIVDLANRVFAEFPDCGEEAFLDEFKLVVLKNSEKFDPKYYLTFKGIENEDRNNKDFKNAVKILSKRK